jgi:hypothetical protein
LPLPIQDWPFAILLCIGFTYDRSNDRIRKTKEAIDTAIRLDPELPEIHMALGQYYYWCLLDYQKALEEFYLAEKGFAITPNAF